MRSVGNFSGGSGASLVVDIKRETVGRGRLVLRDIRAEFRAGAVERGEHLLQPGVECYLSFEILALVTEPKRREIRIAATYYMVSLRVKELPSIYSRYYGVTVPESPHCLPSVQPVILIS